MTGGRLPQPGTPDVWWIDRTRAPPPTDDADDDLSIAERIRAPARRERFLRARRSVRHILARYLDFAPHTVPITLSAHGKPLLSNRFGLTFSISHCGDWTVLAVTAGTAIGVDAVDHAEFGHAGVDAVPLVASVKEHAALAARGQDVAAHRRLWVRKEALGKALGNGLLADLQAIEIGHVDATRPSSVPTPAGLFYVIDCPAPINVTAAVCALAPLHALRLRDEAASLQTRSLF